MVVVVVVATTATMPTNNNILVTDNSNSSNNNNIDPAMDGLNSGRKFLRITRRITSNHRIGSTNNSSSNDRTMAMDPISSNHRRSIHPIRTNVNNIIDDKL